LFDNPGERPTGEIPLLLNQRFPARRRSAFVAGMEVGIDVK
jgi:hypothetical protein